MLLRGQFCSRYISKGDVMALSKEARERLIIALTSRPVGKEVADAIDSGSNQQAADVADIVVGTVSGVDGTGNNAASVSDTQDELDALGDKINDILAALRAAGIMA